jgi:hypothetical protein
MDNMVELYPQDLLCEAKKRVAEKYLFQRKWVFIVFLVAMHVNIAQFLTLRGKHRLKMRWKMYTKF